jgi:hypothetical protein
MKVCIVASAKADHQTSWGGAFANGLLKHGIDAEITSSPKPCDMLVLWGVRNKDAISRQRVACGTVCILERGYLGDRFRWSSVSFGGGLNGRGEFRGVRDDAARFAENFGPMKPWVRRDGYALLIGQVPGDMSISHVNIDQWYRDTTAALRERAYEVRFRPHPVAIDRGFKAREIPGAQIIGGTLAEAMQGASVVVTFNSNTAVESVIAGVPAIAADQGSMAWDVTSRLPGEIETPPREEWAARLAWKQWTMDEMSSGFCWEVIGDALGAVPSQLRLRAS